MFCDMCEAEKRDFCVCYKGEPKKILKLFKNPIDSRAAMNKDMVRLSGNCYIDKKKSTIHTGNISYFYYGGISANRIKEFKPDKVYVHDIDDLYSDVLGALRSVRIKNER